MGDENEISLAALIFCSGDGGRDQKRQGGAAAAVGGRMNAPDADGYANLQKVCVMEKASGSRNSEKTLGPSFNRI